MMYVIHVMSVIYFIYVMCTYIYIYIYVCTHINMYVCMYVYIYIYIYIPAGPAPERGAEFEGPLCPLFFVQPSFKRFDVTSYQEGTGSVRFGS